MDIVSFFSGVGGLDLGFEQAGFQLKEVFITVDYTTAVATTPFIGMKSGKYKIVSGKIKI